MQSFLFLSSFIRSKIQSSWNQSYKDVFTGEKKKGKKGKGENDFKVDSFSRVYFTMLGEFTKSPITIP